MKRVLSVFLASACLALLAGCGKVEPEASIKIELGGDDGTRVRGFWKSQASKTKFEETHEFLTYAPDTITATAPGLKYFSVRKMSEPGVLEVLITVDGKPVFEKTVESYNEDVIYEAPAPK